MEGNPDVELESENSLSSSPRPARKNITLKLKSEKASTSSSRGRPRKTTKSSKKDDQDQYPSEEEMVEAPIFKTMEPGEPLHHNKKLHWDHKVNLIGEKVVDPLIHCCEKCSLPILIYGRMIQCKHVFCFTCAKKTEKKCPRCGDPVQRIEQSALGTVFLCTYGGSKHGVNGCRRTYLSQRDLNAHIGHRHLKQEMIEQASKATTSTSQRTTGIVTPSKTVQPTQPAPTLQNQQQLLEQFAAAVRQATASVAAMPQRSNQEEVYQQNPMPHMQHPPPLSSHQQMMPHSYPGTVMQSMPPMSVSQPAMAQPTLSTSLSSDNYASSIPVVGNRIKTIISVPIQEDEFKQQQAPSYHGMPPGGAMPPVNFPPPAMGQFPVGNIGPNLHQPPPGLPQMFPNQPIQGGPLPNPIHSSPMSQSMPAGMPHGPPPLMSGGQVRGPPARMTAPPGGPPPRFFENQAPRGPWPGGPPGGPPRAGPGGPPGAPPRGPPPAGSQQRAPRPPQADYNYY